MKPILLLIALTGTVIVGCLYQPKEYYIEQLNECTRAFFEPREE